MNLDSLPQNFAEWLSKISPNLRTTDGGNVSYQKGSTLTALVQHQENEQILLNLLNEKGRLIFKAPAPPDLIPLLRAQIAIRLRVEQTQPLLVLKWLKPDEPSHSKIGSFTPLSTPNTNAAMSTSGEQHVTDTAALLRQAIAKTLTEIESKSAMSESKQLSIPKSADGTRPPVITPPTLVRLWQQTPLHDPIQKHLMQTLLPLVKELDRMEHQSLLPTNNRSSSHWPARLAANATNFITTQNTAKLSKNETTTQQEMIRIAITRVQKLIAEPTTFNNPSVAQKNLRYWLQNVTPELETITNTSDDITTEHPDRKNRDLNTPPLTHTNSATGLDIRTATSTASGTENDDPLLLLLRLMMRSGEQPSKSTDPHSPATVQAEKWFKPVANIQPIADGELPDLDQKEYFNQLLQSVQQTVIRQQSHAMRSLVSEWQGQTQWYGEVPVQHQNRCDLWQVAVQPDPEQEKNTSENKEKNTRYCVRLRFDLPGLGACQFVLNMQDKNINIKVYAENSDSLSAFDLEQNVLSDWLASDALLLDTFEAFHIPRIPLLLPAHHHE